MVGMTGVRKRNGNPAMKNEILCTVIMFLRFRATLNIFGLFLNLPHKEDGIVETVFIGLCVQVQARRCEKLPKNFTYHENKSKTKQQETPP